MADSLVFDVGGTTLRAGRYSFSERELTGVQKISTPNIWNTRHEKDHLYTYLINEMEGLAKRLFHKDDPEVVIIGFPSPITPCGEILRAPTIWGDQLKGSASLILSLQNTWPKSKVYIINDVSAAGYFLNQNHSEDFCVITVSSGIGSKLFINGKPYTGAMGRGGEIGHWVTDPSDDALICECGGKGHLGGIVSGRGVLALAKKQAQLDPKGFMNSALFKNTNAGYSGITNELLVEAYLRGDEWTKKIINKTAKELAKAIALIHTTTGLGLFIIVGGFALALGEPYRKTLVMFAGQFCWDLGQSWDKMIQLGPDNMEIGLMGAGIFSETVRN